MAITSAYTKNTLQHASDRLQLGMYRNKPDYFYDFLLAYGIPLEVIKQLKEDELENGIDDHGDIALSNNIYFMALPASDDPVKKLLSTIRFDAAAYRDIPLIFITNFNSVAAYSWADGTYLFVPMAQVVNNHTFFDALTTYTDPNAQTKDLDVIPDTANGIADYVPVSDESTTNSDDVGIADESEALKFKQWFLDPELTDGKSCFVTTSKKPLSAVKAAFSGSVARDGGGLLLSADEKADLLDKHPEVEGLIKPLLRPKEFLGGESYFCLWLNNAESHVKTNGFIKDRVGRVKRFRLASKSEVTRENFAKVPHLFTPDPVLSEDNWLVFSSVSHKKFDYMPLGFLPAGTVVNLPMYVVPNASLYDFAILMSKMHNVWRTSLKAYKSSSDAYRLNAIYNTFPWPDSIEWHPYCSRIHTLAQNVLLAREEYPNRSLAELYDPDKMPDNLRAAHKTLDLAVDRLYREAPFRDNTERLEHLFMRYEKLVANEGSSKNLKTIKGE